jgi:hypothetical protein
VDLYGLGARAASTGLGTDFYSSATPDPTDASLLAANFLTSATSVGSTTFSLGLLTTYLNAQYAGGAGIGQFVFLRLNADAAAGSASANDQRYRIATANNNLTTYSHIAPVIDFAAVPEPASLA